VAPAAAVPAQEDSPFAEPGDATPAVPPPPPPRPVAPTPPTEAAATAAAPAPGAEAALEALLRGAGLSPSALRGAAEADPIAVLEQAGATLRAAIAGLRSLLIARADVKREFRIEQTMLRSAGNNPVKFAATDEAAMAALVAGPAAAQRPGSVSPLAAVEETVHDLTAHQVASLAATQAAARALLARLAPEQVESADQGGGGLFASREKRLWEAYRRLHAQVTEQFDDDFDSTFGKEFARAYEQASAASRR
jgi:type VI secretion system protein ImpI/type VI secretion system protein